MNDLPKSLAMSTLHLCVLALALVGCRAKDQDGNSAKKCDGSVWAAEPCTDDSTKASNPEESKKPTVAGDDQAAQRQREEEQQNALLESGPTAKVQILETSDLHVWMENFDYYKNEKTNNYGFVRTAMLIEAARRENPNSFLVDNGDLIQGNPLGDYAFKSMNLATDTHPVYKAMNLLDYDVGNIGNHEFNYGLEHLRGALTGARFAYVSGNTFIDDGDGDASNDRPFLAPYHIVTKEVTLEDGTKRSLKIGFMGFVPPQIMIWDKTNLTGKLRSDDIVDRAKTLIAQMRAEGADVVIAVPHSGINAAPRVGGDENVVYYLSQIVGIDGILCGHSHQVFPSATYSNIPNTDIGKGLINGIPVVMPGQWGSHLGVVDLTMKATPSGWKIQSATAMARPVAPLAEDAVNLLVRSAVKPDHDGTNLYLQQDVGETATRIHSYFSMVRPSYAVQLINDSQKWYVENLLLQNPEQYAAIKDLPVLSASAPLKAGGKPDNYTDVAPGRLSLRSVADMYVYPNTLKVVKIKGADVIEWLEMAAGAFNTILPNTSTDQLLLNPMFPGYNFDVMSGVTYQIDLSKPARYSKAGQLIAPESHRVVQVEFRGAPVDPLQDFLVATNNYRASGGGSFPGLNGSSIVIDTTTENREILRDYVTTQMTVGVIEDNNWSLVTVPGALSVILRTAPKAREVLPAFSAVVADAGDEPGPEAAGFARFRLLWPTP